MAWRFLFVILTLGDYHQHAWSYRLPRPIREIYEAFTLETIEGLICCMPDPVTLGLVDSLARPGGNITGLTNITTVLAGKRLELLKETIPQISRVAPASASWVSTPPAQ